MKRFIPVMTALSLLWQVPAGQARELKGTGGLSTGYDYYDRQQKAVTPTDDTSGSASAVTASDKQDDYRKIIVRPLITLEAVAEKDALEIRYEPGFYYDDLNDQHDINHKASFSGRRLVTKDWQLLLADSYEIKDDANQTETAVNSPAATAAGDVATATTSPASSSEQLSADRGRRRYTTNSLQALSEYQYLEDSTFSLGYTNSLLRNDDNVDLAYQDYDKHDGLLALAYRYDQIWKMSFTGHYIRGLFDTPAADIPLDAAVAPVGIATDQNDQPAVQADDLSNDLTEYHTEVSLESSLIPRQPLRLGYSRAAYDYDSELQDDTAIHNLTLGWQWQYSPHLTFNAGAGPSYAVTDNQDDTWGYNGELGSGYKLERGNFSLAVEKGLERQNFTGQTVANGLTDFWDTRANFSYNLLASTTVSLFTGYRYEDQDELTAGDVVTTRSTDPALQTDAASAYTAQTDTITTKRLTAGCSAKYSFWQWYAVDLSYKYANQVSERAEDQYDDHQVMLTLSFEKEVFRW